ncbi:MAG: DUF975 family protein [Oscillospiraceae bacterium]|nr:DUF975 family protein [Oscillospiraceae bacterium]
MWTRADLKARAKMTLKGHYWTAFVASLVVALVSGGGGSSLGGAAGSEFGSAAETMPPEYAAGFAIGIIIAAAAGLAVAIFLGSVLEVGARRYFTSACCRHYDLGNLGFAFKQGRYGNVVKVQLIRGIKEFVWFLVFIIPGIIKGYAWCLVPYILADNPHLDHKRALQLSDKMTMGHKAEIFVLELSFIGWYLLGALCCGVGVAFVNPYHDSTMAELYMQLRHEALQRGDTTMEELCLSYN